MEPDDDTAQQIVEDTLQLVAKMRVRSKWLRLKTSKTNYDEFVLTLESAEFYLYRMQVIEANIELSKALDIIEKI